MSTHTITAAPDAPPPPNAPTPGRAYTPIIPLVMLVGSIVVLAADVLLLMPVLANLSEEATLIAYVITLGLSGGAVILAIHSGHMWAERRWVSMGLTVAAWLAIGIGIVLVRVNLASITLDEENKASDAVVAWLMLGLYVGAGISMMLEGKALHCPARSAMKRARKELRETERKLADAEALLARVERAASHVAAMGPQHQRELEIAEEQLDARAAYLKAYARDQITAALGDPRMNVSRQPHEPQASQQREAAQRHEGPQSSGTAEKP